MTEQGANIRDLYTIVFLIAATIFFIVEGLIVYTVLRYRRQPDDELPAQTHGNAIAELVWTVVPTIIVAVLFVVSWQTLNVVDTTTAQPDIKIRAVAGQFQWQFDYMPPTTTRRPARRARPRCSAVRPARAGRRPVVPTGRTVQLYLTSHDVIHAFYVPQFLFKRDVVPGRVNQFEFKVDEDEAGPDVPRPVRRAVRLRPPDHAVRRARADRPRLRRLAGGEDEAPRRPPRLRRRPRPRPARPRAVHRSPERPCRSSPRTHGVRDPDRDRPGERADHHQVRQPGRAVPHNVKIFKDTIGGEVVYDGKIFPVAAKNSYPVGPLPPARTPSSASSTRT